MSPPIEVSRKSGVFIFQTAAGLVVFFLGLLVIIGWSSGNRTLLQISPAFAPMQFNTALGFLLSGAALICSVWNLKKTVSVLSLLIFSLGFLTLIEYIAGLNLGIDELFMRHYITVETSHPGRMAPNTALCFFLSGIALFISYGGLNYSRLISSSLGAIVAALGIVAMCGYLINFPTAYGWGSLTRMAVHTSCGFIFVGSVLVSKMWDKSRNDKTILSYRLPVVMAVGGLTVTVCLWQALSLETASVNTFLDEIILLIGLIFSALLAGAVHLYQKSRLNAREKDIANKNLMLEVNERKKMEAVLRETSAFRKAILDSANYMIISTDTDGTILTFNKTAENLLGYKAEEVIGKFSPEIIHIEDELIEYAEELNEEGFDLTPGLETVFAKARRNTIDEREWTYLTKTGESFPVMLSTTPLLDDDGNITGFLAVGRDISELKQAREELLQSEVKFTAFMNNSPVLAFIKDAQGRFVYVNKLFESYFKIESETFLGKTDFDWIPKELAERTRRDEEKVTAGEIVKTIGTVPKRNGTEDYWLAIKFPITNPNGSVYVGGVGIDITESKRLEAELMRATDTALQSARLKSEFLANMSHEIRTPMNGVIGMAEILLETDLNKAQRDYAETIQQSAEALLTIINDILDFSKIEAGKITFETIDFGLRSTVENVTTMFANAAARKNIEIVSLVEMNVPTALRGDPGRLKQILVNLVGNAVKFTDEGSIYIKVSNIGETKEAVNLQFDVADTGIGIRTPAQNRLFESFTQADGSMTRKYGGTGLGLAICKQLVEMMDGEIKVESEYGQGSTFTFTVRLEKQTVQAKPEIEPITNIEGLRALIVDDNVVNREIILHQISSWGIKAIEAEDARSALKLLNSAVSRNDPFDLIFLDLMMPEIDGFELARLIRNDKRLTRVKIILMPSFGRRGHAQDALNAGIDAYLVKPIRHSDLYDCVVTVLGKSKHKRRKAPDKLITRHTISEKRLADEIRLLIAEDNPINQKVVKSQIEHLGYDADIVSNGLEVIEALKKRRYSLILMDCQMPEMNGYETAAEIRRNEPEEKHIPIIAITANTLADEKEKCLAAGMDDYLAKPFKQEEISQTIEHWLKISKTHQIPPDEAVIKTSREFDFIFEVSERLNELKDEVGEELVESIVALFIEDSIRRLKKMHEIFKKNDFLDEVKIEIHSLKGSSANIGAKTLTGLCAELEKNLDALKKSEIKNRFAEIETAFLILFEELETLELQTEEILVKT